MARIPFSEVLKNASVDLSSEYGRLYELFYINVEDSSALGNTISEHCASRFKDFPYRGTCISLDDFEKCHNLNFVGSPHEFDIDYLVSFCEYSYNIVVYCSGSDSDLKYYGMHKQISFFLQQIERVIEKIGYMPNSKNGITDFVPKDPTAISVSEIVEPEVSYSVIEYNHHSMKGDLKQKRAILIALADQLEPQRAKLKSINSSFEDDLFFLFNNVNLRHNNCDPEGKKYHSYVAAMKKEDIEQLYDDTYQMCLLAFLELDHMERKERVKKLKQNIQK